MVYVISDIHGEFDRYRAMLEHIRFSDQDTLYILGDSIDRNPGGADILLNAMNRSNVVHLLGNHELLCWNTLGSCNAVGARQLWQQNGGECTRWDLLYHRTSRERAEILNFIRDMPDHLDIEVGGRKFHLVHGYPADNQLDRVWERPLPTASDPIPGATTIVGHTPTSFLVENFSEPLCIWHGDGIVDIDCGCGSKSELRRLACLRLDDMMEFYI